MRAESAVTAGLAGTCQVFSFLYRRRVQLIH